MLEEFHSVLFEIMEEFQRVCEKHDIKYSIAYGTLIGAVRHQGFIPWDDDVDIIMSREELEKFCKIYEKEGNKKFFLQTKYTDENYPYNVVRLRKNGTAMIYETWEKAGFHQGIYIDIFPIDHIPDNKVKWFFQKWSIIFLTPIRISQNKEIFIKGGASVNGKIKRMIYPFTKLFPKKGCQKLEDKIIKKYNVCKTKKVGIICEGQPLLNLTGSMQPFDSKFMDEYIEINFNGKKFMCIKEYDKLLKLHYGNYMLMPPEKDRHMYHNPKYFSTTVNYLEFLDSEKI